MAPPAPRESNQPARSASHHKQSTHRTSQRSVLHRNQFAAHRPAHRIPCIASHCIANNPHTVQRAARTDNQPAAHRPQRTAHTSHLQLCTRFAVLCARLFGSWD
jgi:hypothetical protein